MFNRMNALMGGNNAQPWQGAGVQQTPWWRNVQRQQPAQAPNQLMQQNRPNLQSLLQQGQPSPFSFRAPPQEPNHFQNFLQRPGVQMPSTSYFQLQQPAVGPSRLPPALHAALQHGQGGGFGRFAFGAPDNY
jgi:hypothetical protein